MPITPFHFGPGAVVKAVAPRHFSFTVFAFTQVLIDLESIGFFMHGDVEPFAPFSAASPWLHAVDLGTLHLACIGYRRRSRADRPPVARTEKNLMSGTSGLSPAVLSEIAPGGRLRAGINYGNVVLASRAPASGELRGVTVAPGRD